MNKVALIVAGGKGSRMQSELPKQFMLLLESPVLMHTMERFAQAYEDIELVVVLPEDQQVLWENLCRQMDFDIPHTLVKGGETRYDSVKNGLAACPNQGLVAIHDGVRPLVSIDLIELAFDQAAMHGSALPVLPITQSLRKVEGGLSHPVDREGMVEVQTPQCFDLAKIKPCYAGPFKPGFTDDATVYELGGNTVHLIQGETSNIKITTPSDMKVAEAIIAASRPTKR